MLYFTWLKSYCKKNWLNNEGTTEPEKLGRKYMKTSLCLYNLLLSIIKFGEYMEKLPFYTCIDYYIFLAAQIGTALIAVGFSVILAAFIVRYMFYFMHTKALMKINKK
jgi:hypothetical protein